MRFLFYIFFLSVLSCKPGTSAEATGRTVSATAGAAHCFLSETVNPTDAALQDRVEMNLLMVTDKTVYGTLSLLPATGEPRRGKISGTATGSSMTLNYLYLHEDKEARTVINVTILDDHIRLTNDDDRIVVPETMRLIDCPEYD